MTLVIFYLSIRAYLTEDKRQLYDWLAQQGWQADRDFWMGVYGQGHQLSMQFDNPSKAAMFKLAWSDACVSTQSVSPITALMLHLGSA